MVTELQKVGVDKADVAPDKIVKIKAISGGVMVEPDTKPSLQASPFIAL